MTENSTLIPDGIGHEPELGALSPADRLKHHQRLLRTIALHQGIDGVKAYKASFPEASALRIHSAPVAYAPKPRGYASALTSTVRDWFHSETALAQTNRADVDRLNAALGTTFNPANHFSKPLSAAVLRELAELFAEHGAQLDTRQATTMAKVRKAVRAARAGGEASAVPIGSWGVRQDNRLFVAAQTFAIERHNGHECLRVPVDGQRGRLRLDALSEFLSTTGLVPAAPLHTTTCSVGELAPDPVPAPEPPGASRDLPEIWPRQPNEPETLHRDLAPDQADMSLAARISRLPRPPEPLEQPPVDTDGADPLALI